MGRKFERYFSGEPRFKRKPIDVPFETPVQHERFSQGNMHCNCMCYGDELPRNAILIQVKNKDNAKPVYDNVVTLWQNGHFNRMKLGTCQTFIRTREIAKEIDPHIANISCIDNIDNTTLKSGDILINRVESKRSVGKPFYIH